MTRRLHRDVAIVAFSQMPHVDESPGDEVEMLLPILRDVVARSGIDKQDIGFICSGSCDYVIGRPFAFVTAVDAIGAWPPVRESHVEMDGAWALFEAWLRLQHGDIDSALVYAFGRNSLGSLPDIQTQGLDPYYLAPLWPDGHSLAALQARALLDTGRYTEEDFAEVYVRNMRAGLDNPFSQRGGVVDADDLLTGAYAVAPLREHDLPPVSDGAAAVVLVAGDKAREVCENPAWIRMIDHRVEPHSLGARDLSVSVSTQIATRESGAAEGGFDVAELCAPYTHQELILRDAMGSALEGEVSINPSGGAQSAHAFMVSGLVRFGEAAARIHAGEAGRALAHATGGPCLQHNMVGVLEGGQ